MHYGNTAFRCPLHVPRRYLGAPLITIVLGFLYFRIENGIWYLWLNSLDFFKNILKPLNKGKTYERLNTKHEMILFFRARFTYLIIFFKLKSESDIFSWIYWIYLKRSVWRRRSIYIIYYIFCKKVCR